MNVHFKVDSLKTKKAEFKRDDTPHPFPVSQLLKAKNEHALPPLPKHNRVVGSSDHREPKPLPNMAYEKKVDSSLLNLLRAQLGVKSPVNAQQREPRVTGGHVDTPRPIPVRR